MVFRERIGVFQTTADRQSAIWQTNCARFPEHDSRDMDAGNVSIRLHAKGPQEAKQKAAAIAGIVAAITVRQA